MTGNVSLWILRKGDMDKNGFLELMDITNLKVEDPVSYELLEDLYNLSPDFMDKHRQVLTNAGSRQQQP